MTDNNIHDTFTYNFYVFVYVAEQFRPAAAILLRQMLFRQIFVFSCQPKDAASLRNCQKKIRA